MNRTILRRSIIAVSTTIACLAVMATPAAAVTHDVAITGGVLTFTKTGMTPETLDLTPACPTTHPSTLELDVTGTAVSVTALSARSVRLWFSTSTLSVFTRITPGSTAGTLTGTAVSSMRVGVHVDIYAAYDPATCTPTGDPVCRIAFLLQLGGTLSGTTASSTLSLTGSSVGIVVSTYCAAGPSVLVGTAATVSTPIAGHLTT